MATLVGDAALSVSKAGIARLTDLDTPTLPLRDALWRASRACLSVDDRMALLGEHEEEAWGRYCSCNGCYGETPSGCVGRPALTAEVLMLPGCPGAG